MHRTVRLIPRVVYFKILHETENNIATLGSIVVDQYSGQAMAEY